MATQLTGAAQRRRSIAGRFQRAPRPVGGRRHPVVALAMALPCAIALVLLFGGWEQIATQTKAVADLIGR